MPAQKFLCPPGNATGKRKQMLDTDKIFPVLKTERLEIVDKKGKRKVVLVYVLGMYLMGN